MTWLNIGCGTHLAPQPWVNIDCADNDNTHPDVLVCDGDPLPWGDGEADRVYLGHVLEHVPWPRIPPFLAEVRRVLHGDLLVTGPDVYRTLALWCEGRLPWDLVTSVLEHAEPASLDNGWPQASHHWNCHEARVVQILTLAGFTEVTPRSIHDLEGWPIMSPSDWQLAVSAT